MKLKFDNTLVNSIIDRFGKDVSLEKADEGHFNIRVNVAVSNTFLSLVFQFGSKVKILSPEGVVMTTHDPDMVEIADKVITLDRASARKNPGRLTGSWQYVMERRAVDAATDVGES